MRLYADLGLVDGLVDTETGRVAPKGIDEERLLEASFTPRRMVAKRSKVIPADRRGCFQTVYTETYSR